METNDIQLGGTGIFFTAVMGDRPYCKITVVVPTTATDEEIEHAAERYRKVAEVFDDIVKSVVGPGWGTEPIPISDQPDSLDVVVEKYSMRQGTDF